MFIICNSRGNINHIYTDQIVEKFGIELISSEIFNVTNEKFKVIISSLFLPTMTVIGNNN